MQAAAGRDRFGFDAGAAGGSPAAKRPSSSKSPKGRPRRFNADVDALGFSDEDTGFEVEESDEVEEQEALIANNPAQSAEFMQALLGREATGMRSTGKKSKGPSESFVSWDVFGKGMPVPGQKGKKGCSVDDDAGLEPPDLSSPFNESEMPNLLVDDGEASGPGAEDGEGYDPFFRIRSPSRSCSRTASAGSRSLSDVDSKAGYKEISFATLERGGDDDGDDEEVADPEAALAALGLGPPSAAIVTSQPKTLNAPPEPEPPIVAGADEPKAESPSSPGLLSEKLGFALSGAGNLDDDDEETADVDDEPASAPAGAPALIVKPAEAGSSPRRMLTPVEGTELLEKLNVAKEAEAAGPAFEAGAELPEEPEEFEVSELEKQMAEQICGVVNSIAEELKAMMNGKIEASNSMNQSVRHLMVAVDVNAETKESLARLEVLTRLIRGVGKNTAEYQQGLRTCGRILKEVVVHFMQVMRGIHTDYLSTFWELFSLLDAETSALIGMTELDPKFHETKAILQKELPELVKDVQQSGKVLKWPRSGRWAYGLDMME